MKIFPDMRFFTSFLIFVKVRIFLCEQLDDGGKHEPLFLDGGSKDVLERPLRNMLTQDLLALWLQRTRAHSGSKLHPRSSDPFTKPALVETPALAYEDIDIGGDFGDPSLMSWSVLCWPWVCSQV